MTIRSGWLPTGLDIRRPLATTLDSLSDLLPISSLLADRSDAVLMYHSVTADAPLRESYGNVTPARLERDLEYITNAYATTDVRSLVAERDPGRKRVALTFDDGFRNFYTEVLPLLRRYDTPATVFVTPGLTDRPAATAATHGLESAAENALLTERQLRELADSPLVTVGNHTNTHPDLTALESAEQRREIEGGRETLEAMLDAPVRQFCYPYGKFDATTASIVAESHDLAVTLTPGVVAGSVDRYRIPRLHGHVSASKLRWHLLRRW